MKYSDSLGVVGAVFAAVMWFVARWAHEVQRCLRGAEAGGRELDECILLLERPMWGFRFWLVLLVVSALWGVFLLARGRRAWGLAALFVALLVFFVAGSLM